VTDGDSSEAARIGMWLFLAAEIMLFGGLFVGFALIRMRHEEAFAAARLHLHRSLGFLCSLAMLSGSLSIAMAAERAKRRFLVATLLCGVVFLAALGFDYASVVARGFRPSQLFFGFYFVMTGLHGLHVLGGIAVVAWLAVRGYGRRIELAGLYWHMLTLLWIFLFPLLYIAA